MYDMEFPSERLKRERKIEEESNLEHHLECSRIKNDLKSKSIKRKSIKRTKRSVIWLTKSQKIKRIKRIKDEIKRVEIIRKSD